MGSWNEGDRTMEYPKCLLSLSLAAPLALARAPASYPELIFPVRGKSMQDGRLLFFFLGCFFFLLFIFFISLEEGVGRNLSFFFSFFLVSFPLFHSFTDSRFGFTFEAAQNRGSGKSRQDSFSSREPSQPPPNKKGVPSFATQHTKTKF